VNFTIGYACPLAEIENAGARDADPNLATDTALDTVSINDTSGGDFIEQNDSYYLPTQLIPITQP
jgi:hypothetical protein